MGVNDFRNDGLNFRDIQIYSECQTDRAERKCEKSIVMLCLAYRQRLQEHLPANVVYESPGYDDVGWIAERFAEG